LSLADRVTFTHGLSDEALLRPAGQRGDAVVPSLYEGFSLPAVEHMASGTPLVASRTGALPEVTGDAAVLVTPGEDEELAAVLRRLHTPPPSGPRWRTGRCAGSASGSPGPRWPGPPSGSTWPRWTGRPPERTGRVLTVDFRRFPVRPGHRVLDLGCGGGRHAFEVYRRGADVVAFDLDPAELAPVRGMFGAMRAAGEAGPEGDAAASRGTPPPCRSATACSTG
jgi:Glycosyltransferase